MSAYNESIAVGVAVSASLSFISTVSLVLFYKFSPSHRTAAFRTVIPLFCVDLAWSINTLMPTLAMLFHNDPGYKIPFLWCRIQGAVKLFTMLASFFITTTIAWTLYSVLIRRKPIRTKNPTKYFAVFTFLVPLLASIMQSRVRIFPGNILFICRPLTTDHYDHVPPLSNVMCFLSVDEDSQGGKTDYMGIIYRIVLYETPFLGCLVFDFYSMICIYIVYRKSQRGDSHELADVRNLMLYPLALFLSFITLAIQRVTEILPGSNGANSLDCVSLALATLNGFLNATVYGFISLDLWKYFRLRYKKRVVDNLTNNSLNVDQYESSNQRSNNKKDNNVIQPSDVDSSFNENSLNLYAHSKQFSP